MILFNILIELFVCMLIKINIYLKLNQQNTYSIEIVLKML